MRMLMSYPLLVPALLLTVGPAFAQTAGTSNPAGGLPPAARASLATAAAQPLTPEARAALEAAGGALGILTLQTGHVSATGIVAAAVAGPSVSATLRAAASPTLMAVVRRGGPLALAYRGGIFRRVPDELLSRPGIGPLQGRRICVDAGHGGFSLGAQGLNGLKEKEACLAMCAELAGALQEVGATVIMPRVDDTYVSLEDRIDFANGQSADLFISIHCNAMPTPNTVSGTETYYFTPQSTRLAQALHPALVQTVGGRDGGIRRRGFAVIRRTIMPSVLLEVAYINHQGDEVKLGDPEFRYRVGQAVRDGVLRYFGVQ